MDEKDIEIMRLNEVIANYECEFEKFKKTISQLTGMVNDAQRVKFRSERESYD